MFRFGKYFIDITLLQNYKDTKSDNVNKYHKTCFCCCVNTFNNFNALCCLDNYLLSFLFVYIKTSFI